MPTVNLKNIQGATVGQVELSDELFAAEVNPFAMHLVVRAILNGRRLGTQSALTRTEVRGGQMVRSAGNAAQLMAKEGQYAQVRLPSGEVRKLAMNCRATIGTVGNTDHENVRIGKAGRKRHMGIRPTVRGVVMNPCDHPHGGGEGKSPVGMPAPVTPWGKPALGLKTRKHKKYSNKMIVKRANGK